MAVPFFKFLGGKRQIIESIAAPIKKGLGSSTYFEPFIGGGALFFYLEHKNSVINDISQNLYYAYKNVKDNPEEVIKHVNKFQDDFNKKIDEDDVDLEELKENFGIVIRRKEYVILNNLKSDYKNDDWVKKTDFDTKLKKAKGKKRKDLEKIEKELNTKVTAREAYYYKKRKEFNEKIDDTPERAALFLVLNKLCFNGVYRENSKGEFNVPFDHTFGTGNNSNNLSKYREKKKDRYKWDNLVRRIKEASICLKNTQIYNKDYKEILKMGRQGDFFYLDPPYGKLPKTKENPASHFTNYHRSDFKEKQQEELKEAIVELDKKGAKFVLSNASEGVRALYSDTGFFIETVGAKRTVNSKGSKRGKVEELIITNCFSVK